jgi:archaellum component FlaF (FlaF/FlaG flagellin family)
MTIQPINIGNVVNDGLGDDLRTAFEKVNANFADLSTQLTITATNVGATGVGVFKEKVGADLKFKKLVSGTKMLLNENTDTVTVNNTAPDAFIRIDTDAGVMLASTYQQITMAGTAAPGSTTSRKDIEVNAFGSTISFKTIIPVTDILESYDFGTINGSYTNAMQVALQSANIDFGTVLLPGRIDIDCGSIL